MHTATELLMNTENIVRCTKIVASAKMMVYMCCIKGVTYGQD